MIFLDTNYINGLIIKRDSHNAFSKNIRPFLAKEAKATNITVLVEVLNSLKVNNFNGNFDAIIAKLVNLDVFDYLSVEDYQKAMDLCKFYNFSINFSDCIILVSMEKHRINKIVTNDSDFDKIKGIQRIGGFN